MCCWRTLRAARLGRQWGNRIEGPKSAAGPSWVADLRHITDRTRDEVSRAVERFAGSTCQPAPRPYQTWWSPSRRRERHTAGSGSSRIEPDGVKRPRFRRAVASRTTHMAGNIAYGFGARAKCGLSREVAGHVCCELVASRRSAPRRGLKRGRSTPAEGHPV